MTFSLAKPGLAALLALALLQGCASTGAPANTLTIFNRTPDKVTVELIPFDMEDYTTSPLYQKVELPRKTHKAIMVHNAYYSVRVTQDDWEGEISGRLDENIRTDGILTVEHGCILHYEEEEDPLFAGQTEIN